MILRARSVLPVARPPIDDGLVFVAQGVIRAAGPRKDLHPHLAGREDDLGAVTLLPGLINAHCHLDYTDMAGMIPPPHSFTDWIKSITALKAEWSYTEFADSWLQGARMLLRSGITTVGDVEAAPELLPDVWPATPLRVRSFLEMTGVRSRRQPRQILQEALDLDGQVGVIADGAWADLLVLPLEGPLPAAEEQAVHFHGAPARLMIAGDWIELGEACTPHPSSPGDAAAKPSSAEDP
jgi:cytosine/adenosine deaminase-related metal-dependent hydrolase